MKMGHLRCDFDIFHEKDVQNQNVDFFKITPKIIKSIEICFDGMGG